MTENCSHNCNTCGASCPSRNKNSLPKYQTNKYSKIKKIIGVISGKGGVGKSLVTSSMAVAMTKLGYRCAILDADVTGPSIPKAFGITNKASGYEEYLYSEKTKTGIQIMSVNLLLENETDPLIVRGPVINGVVKQFYTDVIWKDVDFMFVDMPPGTGDVALTIFQSIPVDGIIIVTSPQELVSIIVEKAVKMADKMNIKTLGFVENMSFFHCPDNGIDYKIFGESHIDDLAERTGIPVLAKLPIDPEIAKLVDSGKIEDIDTSYFKRFQEVLKNL